MSEGAVTYDFLEAPRLQAKAGATARVYAALREAIVSLELRPGESLDKQAIAARLGVSRFPVGEALTRLAAEALVEIVPQSGSRVALIRLSDARENMFLRRAIETEAIRVLTKSLGAALLEDLRINLRYQAAAVDSGDHDGFHRFDLQFHALLLDGLGFERVRQVSDTARLGLERVRRMLSAQQRRRQVTLEEHRAIVAALECADATAAVAAMERHLAAVMTDLESFAGDNPQLFADLTFNGGSTT